MQNRSTEPESFIPTFGFVPPTFPRDPVHVNEFYEHILLGQILQPLVEADHLGRIFPGVASDWEFSSDGKRIEFTIRSGIRFSNGSPITSNDVKTTLLRHLQNDSQSRTFLRGIANIDCESDQRLTIEMADRNLGLLKALSRDQLGIQPVDWKFDSTSTEPFIGSGHYRLVRDDAQWFFKLNPLKEDVSSATFKKWKLVYFANAKYELPPNTLPDYLPFISRSIREAVERHPNFMPTEFTLQEQLSFAQTSIWWNPHGPNYESDTDRSIVMDTLHRLVDMGVSNRNLVRSTGIIPQGIAGHLESPIKLPALHDAARLPGDTTQTVRVGARAGIFDFLFDTEEAKALQKKRNLKFEVINIAPAAMKSLRDQRFDVVMGGWAGGFNDPDGFVPVAT